MDDREQSHARTTARARQDVDREDAAQQLSMELAIGFGVSPSESIRRAQPRFAECTIEIRDKVRNVLYADGQPHQAV
jgi:hypothetical protein